MSLSTYDDTNIFARILRGDIPNDTVYEDDHVLAFRDITPKRDTHVLIIPKGAFTDMTDFSSSASDAQIVALIRAVGTVADMLGLTKNGYRVITNIGAHGGQEVPHLHLHILGGEPVGPMVNG